MTPQGFHNEFKICPVCLQRFYRPRSCSPANWAGRINCSDPCRHKYMTALAAGHVMVAPDQDPVRREADPTWRDRAACRFEDPEIFFPLSNDWKGRPDAVEVEQAKTVCAGCPSRTACLDDALASRDAWSIRGGLTPQERSHLPVRAAS